MNVWEHADIQGLVFSGYGSTMLAAAYHLLRIDDPAAAKPWLAALANRVTPGDPTPNDTRTVCLNVAFTRSGLEKLGVPAARIDATFEPAFQEGMISPRRTRILGDSGPSAPDQWNWGGPKSGVDVLLMLFALNADGLKTLEADEEAKYAAGGLSRVVAPIAATPLDPKERFSREHFGFADGISQPTPVIAETDAALQAAVRADADAVPAGEFVFGYKNAYGNLPLVPGRDPANPDETARSLGTNGSFVVVRQFEQHVSAFWNFLLARAGNDPQRAERIAAKMVGRWPSGAVVRENELTDPGLPQLAVNTFDFATDQPKTAVPIGSHIRRSNPRATVLAEDPETALMVARRHRMIRRARSYGPFVAGRYQPDDGQTRGLLFLAVNANIERQFEFIMHSWMHNPVFGSLYQETDPLIGDASRIVDANFTPATTTDFTIPAAPIRERVKGLPRFVTVVGGAYFFLPGLAAIRSLAG